MSGGPVARPGPLARAPWPVPPRVLHWGMDAAYLALASALPLYALARLLADAKTRSRWLAYLKDIPARFGTRARRARRRPCVWIHGVSVGEVKAAARLVERIEETLPGVEVVISVTTDTGSRVARKRYPGHRVEFYPPDLSWIVRDAVDAIAPDLVILVESEFWPNFLWTARERGIPVALVNGRLSARSARRFARLKPWGPALLAGLEAVCVQVPAYAERFVALGVEPGRVRVTGNMKFDNIPIQPDDERREWFAGLLGVEGGPPLLVAGSTHPGEERLLAGLHRRLWARGLPLRLVLVPRHPGRVEHVEADVRREGGRARRRSRLPEGAPLAPDEIVILDSVGELEVVYALSDLVFVGGTLVPHGGQNVMEPASLGKPVVIGPEAWNFRGEVDLLAQAGGIVSAAGIEAVEATVAAWLLDPQAARAVGQRAQQAIDGSKGATEATLDHLEPLLRRLATGARVPGAGAPRPGPPPRPPADPAGPGGSPRR